MVGRIAISRSLCLFLLFCLCLSIGPRKYSRAITGCELLSIRQVYTVDYFICCFVLFSGIPDLGTSGVCDGRILSCDARILRERERASDGWSRWGARADSDQDQDEFEPDNDQGFLPTRLSVKIKKKKGGWVWVR